MASYTKLFSSIVTSTIWTEDDKTRIAWITMLAIADKNGEVQASIPGLARIAGLSVDDTQAAIDKFLAPDKYSRTPDDEGRRIEPIDGGWLLLNHAKYRALASKDETIAANAERQRRHRERKKRNATVTHSNGFVTASNASVTQDRDIAEAEADTEAKAVKTERVATAPSRFSKPSVEDVASFGLTLSPPFTKAAEFVDFYESKGWKIGSSPMKNWQATVRNWHRKDSTPAAKNYSHANGYNESTDISHL